MIQSEITAINQTQSQIYSKYIMTCYLTYLKCCYTQFSSIPMFYIHVRLLTSLYISKCQFEQIIWIYHHPACVLIVTYNSITAYPSLALGFTPGYLMTSGVLIFLFLRCVFVCLCSVACFMCLWIVYSWLCLRCSLTLFIYEYPFIQSRPPSLFWFTLT